ncbi:hypothetical protein Csa_006414 [Cucumis sativus]|uniref:Uncharacterized protein n=1 Tax=Cucumis sativus TaxID=3659 RepID=A0A0A0LM46_CUCSA|nr:hypothetical protein Csa_006414 [Cucumis sativus]
MVLKKTLAFSCNNLLQLLAFIFLFFLLITTTGSSARSLVEGRSRNDDDPYVKNHSGVIGNDLVTMDYTPARKNHPIHN